jgi:mannan endo-1,4-beta-mannosidase
MNGSWFWWGGRPGKDGSAALYRQLYDRFVNVHHLDNLLWAWNVNAPNGSNAGVIEAYYPGPQVADLLTIDIYGEFKQEYYTEMLALAGDKPIALGEVGKLPSPEVFQTQPRWTYFMDWSEIIQRGNPLELVNAVYHAPQVLTRDDPRLAGPLAAIRKATAERLGAAPEAAPAANPAPAQ